MTETNIQNSQPGIMDYASPIQFRFKCTKMPLVEYFCQTANIPGISLGSAIVPTSMYDYPVPGDNISYQSFDISFLVDENLNNYKELHDWISGLGFPKNHEQFANLQGSGSDRFPGTTSSTAATGTSVPKPLDEGGIYADATLSILNSKNIVKTEIRFQNLYPTSLGGLNYDVKMNDVDYLQATVSFAYMYYEIIQISTT